MTDNEIISGALFHFMRCRGLTAEGIAVGIGCETFAGAILRSIADGVQGHGMAMLLEQWTGVSIQAMRDALPAFRAGTPGNLINTLLAAPEPVTPALTANTVSKPAAVAGAMEWPRLPTFVQLH